jgi:hypothetical protein
MCRVRRIVWFHIGTETGRNTERIGVIIIPRTVLATGIWSTRVPTVVGSDPTGDGSVVMSNEKDLVTRVSEVVDGEFVKLFDVKDGIRWCVCCCFEGQLLFLRWTGEVQTPQNASRFDCLVWEEPRSVETGSNVSSRIEFGERVRTLPEGTHAVCAFFEGKEVAVTMILDERSTPP